jgi:hypothetical protein
MSIKTRNWGGEVRSHLEVGDDGRTSTAIACTSAIRADAVKGVCEEKWRANGGRARNNGVPTKKMPPNVGAGHDGGGAYAPPTHWYK